MKYEIDRVDETVVTLDTYNSDLNLVIDGSKYTAHPLTSEGFAFMWAGARATHGSDKGKFCFEVKIIEHLDVSHLPADEPNPHVVRVGCSVDSTSMQLGEEPLSYGYGGTGKISMNCQFKDFGPSFTAGDCVLAMVNAESDPVQIGFAKNGKFAGWAYKVNKTELKGKALFPHILTKNCSFEVNFGQKDEPFFKLPDAAKDFTFIGCSPMDKRVAGTRAPAKREECEMIMMCGLPGAGKSVWAAEYSLKHPDKKYNILGSNNIIDKMKVMGLPRKRNYHGRWDVLIQMATKCLNTMFSIGSKLRRNYILDQTNVYPTAQRRKMRNFDGFKRIAVVVVPTEAEYKKRCDKRDREEGKEIPDAAVLEMKANFKVPENNDIFDEIIFTETQREEAEKLVKQYNEEGKAATGPAKKQFRSNEPRGFEAGKGNFGFNKREQEGGPNTYGGYQGGSHGRDNYNETPSGFGGRGGYDTGREPYGRSDDYGRGGGYDQGGYGGYQGGRGGGFDNGRGGRGGFDNGRGGRGGFDNGRGGRGGFDNGRGGRGGFDSSRGGRGGFDSGRGGRGGFDGSRGSRSGFDSSDSGYDSRGGRGGFESRGARGGGFDSGRGERGGFDSGRGERGGFDSSHGGRGGYDSERGGRGGYDSDRGGRGSFDSGRGERSGYDGSRGGRGGYDSDRGGRGGYDSDRGGRGGYDSNRGSYESDRGGRGGYDSGRGGRGGYDNSRGSRGGFDSSRGGRGFESGRGGRGSFGSSGRGGRDAYDSSSGYDSYGASSGRGSQGGNFGGSDSYSGYDKTSAYQQGSESMYGSSTTSSSYSGTANKSSFDTAGYNYSGDKSYGSNVSSSYGRGSSTTGYQRGSQDNSRQTPSDNYGSGSAYSKDTQSSYYSGQYGYDSGSYSDYNKADSVADSYSSPTASTNYSSSQAVKVEPTSGYGGSMTDTGNKFSQGTGYSSTRTKASRWSAAETPDPAVPTAALVTSAAYAAASASYDYSKSVPSATPMLNAQTFDYSQGMTANAAQWTGGQTTAGVTQASYASSGQAPAWSQYGQQPSSYQYYSQ